MPVQTRRARVPEYPRPVSPVSADSIPTCDDTVVYYEPAKDAEEYAEQRAAKKQRIESHATAYLRGQPLFILTAQLRGPFGKGWEDPWGDTSNNKGNETAITRKSSPAFTEPAQGKKQDLRISKADRVARSAAGTSIRATKQPKDNLGPIRSERREKSTGPPLCNDDDLPPENNKVEDWLRRSAVYQRPEHSQQSLSPPSPCEGKAKKWEASKLDVDHLASEDAGVSITSNQRLPSGTTSGSRQSQSFKSSISSLLRPQTPQIAPRPRNCWTSPQRKRDKDEQVCVGDNDKATKQSCANEPGPEYAIIRPQRGAKHRTSFVTAPSNPDFDPQASCNKRSPPSGPQSGVRLEPFVQEREKEPELAEIVTSALNHTSATVPDAQETSSPYPSELAPQSLAKETTKSTITTDLPSAQMPPLALLASLPSNLSSHRQMVDEALDGGDAEAIDTEGRNGAEIVDVTAAGGTKSDASVGPDRECILLTEKSEAAQDIQPKIPIQVNGIGTSPLMTDDASVVSHSLKKPGRGTQNAASPERITKVRATRAKRRDMSPTEDTARRRSTRGSIKSTLKVAKPSFVIQEETAISKTAIPPHEEELQPGSGDDGDGAATNYDSDSAKLLLLASCGPRSILRSFSAQSLTKKVKPSLSTTTNPPADSSSTKQQDAQRQKLLKLVENDDDFDIDAAMDDLGSFLDSWDSEKKEASFYATTATRG
ncbi:uncharacterized protein Z520_00879 [Fonsecaea multimorphosa CBS 102226]|uniref:Uncharacterized protein n=1 Tax=Fonsecaea multimorphosa CBS 102226 TaxID=1442371 RepID=A0A0D2J421_9EURO|nr:uncharacterized protein Z520_00879 [Fonsecaea multimorphosa CBS 102226]KIY04187.1 hypothetical protein Z520_00879 [Fonsecaea multimorphosa CBS 102226]OAL32016.1 hypothetical protein AYO22_00886 [Fonsecaea multimorphosa]